MTDGNGNNSLTALRAQTTTYRLTPNTLPGTALALSPIGLGTVKLGRNQQVKYPRRFKLPDDRTARALLDSARDLGINLLDTAPAYGTSEERLGTLLTGQRQHWVICSKVGEEFTRGQSHFDFTPEHIRFSVKRSLKRLQTDYLDMVLVHSCGDDVRIIQQYGCLEVLAALKQQGLIRAIGMSTKTTAGGIMALQQADTVMVTYNLHDTSQKPVLDYAADHNQGVLIKKALASGHMGASQSPQPFNDNPLYASMRQVYSYSAVVSAVIGTINPHHLQQNVAVYQQVISALNG